MGCGLDLNLLIHVSSAMGLNICSPQAGGGGGGGMGYHCTLTEHNISAQYRLIHTRDLLDSRKTGLLKIIAVSLQPPPQPPSSLPPPPPPPQPVDPTPTSPPPTDQGHANGFKDALDGVKLSVSPHIRAHRNTVGLGTPHFPY